MYVHTKTSECGFSLSCARICTYRCIISCAFAVIRCLLSLGKTNGTIAHVVDAVPLAEESISKDGQRTNRLGEVHTHEGTDARSLDLQDVVIRGDGKVVASQSDCEIGKRVALCTVNSVLSIPRFRGSNLLVPVWMLESLRIYFIW